jgi:hypothetical protein
MQAGTIVRTGAHMHLLGQSMQITLNPGTPTERTILNVPNYDFHYQKSYDLRTPIAVVAGDKIQVSCTYDPTLRQELPSLRNLSPRFVTWGDGSSDEMCLGLVMTVPPADAPGAIGWPARVDSGAVTF